MQDFRSITAGRGDAHPLTCQVKSLATQSVHIMISFALAITAFAAIPAGARDEVRGDSELREERVRWQNRYRDLLSDANRLRSEIDQEQELYADANRRNYRRGSKRHFHRHAMEKAKQELAKIEAELATFEDDARLAGALPGWLRQVELELEDADRRPAVTTGPGDEGRNPLYLKKKQEENN